MGKRRLAKGAISVALAVTALAMLLPGVLAPFPADHRAGVLLAPGTVDEGRVHLLGTDRQGADFLTALLYAMGTSFRLAAIGTVLVLIGAISLGWIQATGRAAVRAVVAALTLGAMSTPDVALVSALRGAWPRDTATLVVNASILATIALVSTPAAARLIASRVQSLDVALFVRASRASGAPPLHTFRREMLPHLVEDLSWIAARAFPFFVHVEVGLAYLGLDYRDTTGLGALLEASFNNFLQVPALLQLLLTVAVLVWISLFPMLVLRRLGVRRQGG